MRMLRTAIAFVKKDYLIAVSYRFDFFLQLLFIVLSASFLYFIGKLVDAGSNPLLRPYGGSYFGFLLIGVAFADYVGVSMKSFSNNIRDAQLTGTLEIILVSPTKLFTFLISASLWSYLFTSFRFLLYLLSATFIFGLSIGKINLPSCIAILLLSIVCFIAIGIMFAALILVVKRGESALNAVGAISLVLGGVIFPPEILPSWMGKLSAAIPFTYSLHGLRVAIFQGSSIEALKGDIITLVAFTILFWIFSGWLFPLAVRKAKIDGTLTQY